MGHGKNRIDKKLRRLDLTFVEAGIFLLGTFLKLFGGNGSTPKQHPSHGYVPHDFQERKCVGKRLFKLGRHGFPAKMNGRFSQRVHRCFQPVSHGNQGFVFSGMSDGLLNLFQKFQENLSFFHTQLSGQQVHGLNAIRPLVEGGYLTISGNLFNRILLGISITTIHLDRFDADIKTSLGTVCFDQWRQKIHQTLIVLLFFCFFGICQFVKTSNSIVGKAAHTLHMSLHPEEHTPHVRVIDYRHLGCFAISELLQIPALKPFTGIIQGIQIRRRCVNKGLKTDTQSCLVHHVEHNAHAMIFLSQQKSPAIALTPQRHTAGGGGMNTHLLLDTGADHIVRLTQAAVIIDPPFRNKKNRDPFSSRRSSLYACKYRVNNIFLEIMLTVGDKYFFPLNRVGAVGILHSQCGQGPDI